MLEALQQGYGQNASFGQSQALARGGETRADVGVFSNLQDSEFNRNLNKEALMGSEARANIGLSADIASREFDQTMRGKEFESSQALARGSEARANLGATGQATNDALQRAIATGDYQLAGKIQQSQAQQAQAGLGLQAAGQTQGRRMDQFGALGDAADRDYARQQFNQQGRAQERQASMERSLAESGLARQDVQIASSLIEQRFQQELSSGKFDLQRAEVDLRSDLAEQGMKREDIERVARLAQQQWSNSMASTGFDSSEQQRIENSRLNAVMSDENIYNQRAALAGQPMSQMLSALSGNNVSPGVLGPMQMPLQQQPGGGFGGAMGGLAGGLAGSVLGPMGAQVGKNLGNRIF